MVDGSDGSRFSARTGEPSASGRLTGAGPLGASPLSELGSEWHACPRCQGRFGREVDTCPNDGAKLVLTDELVGTTLSGTYFVERVIGEGGMGRVYEARHTRIPQKRFAVKALLPEYARQPEVLARFQREAEASAAIASEHVAGVYDVDRGADGRPFMVVEYLDGKELGAYLDAVGKLDVPTAVFIARQVCRALGAAHATGVVHRDVKPENVFLTGDVARPRVKVIDFGISRLEDQAGGSLTRTGMILGTPAYMAPEQARGDRVDKRADLYAVGGILYRALVGRVPFDRPDPSAVVVAVLTEEPIAPRTLEPRIPAALELVIQTAMAKDPARRFPDADALDAALAPFDTLAAAAAAAAAAPSGAPPTSRAPSAVSLGEQARELRSARPFIALLLTVGGAATLLGLVGLLAAFVRAGRGGGPLGAVTGQEAMLIGLAMLGALATPVLLAVLYLRKHTWQNSQRVLELLRRLRAPVLVGLATYGMAALLTRTIELVLLRRVLGITWAGWDALWFLAAVAAAALATLWPRLDARASEHARPTRLLYACAGLGGLALVVALAVQGGTSLDAAGLASAAVAATPSASAATSAAASGTPPASGSTGALPSGAPAHPTAALPPPPRDASAEDIWRELQKQLEFGRLKDAAATFDRLLTADPAAGERPEAREAFIKIYMNVTMAHPAETALMSKMLTERMGTTGPDILYLLLTTRGGTAAADRAAQLLQDPAVRARGTPAMRIAYELRTAACADKPALFERAAAEGDARVLGDLGLLEHCNRRQACCLTGNESLKAAIAALRARTQ
ncbi:MAG: serine/threonine protein kinase [Polyangiaceae bacterium]|nr:serine/threonine protein kinase [Polyangiaceae bacterium]